MDEMRRLVDKYSRGLDDLQEENELKDRKASAPGLTRKAILQESSGNVQ